MPLVRSTSKALLLALALLFATPSMAFGQLQEIESPRGLHSLAFDVSTGFVLTFPFVPDSEITTGSLCQPSDRDFERYRYQERIPYCKRNVDRSMKRKIYEAYGVPERCRREYTIDHLIPLSIGGTNHPNNLWPEHHSIKNLRENLESHLHHQMENGTITQAEAVRQIREAKWNPDVKDTDEFSFCQ